MIFVMYTRTLEQVFTEYFCIPCLYHRSNVPLNPLSILVYQCSTESPVSITVPMFHWTPCQYYCTNVPLDPLSILLYQCSTVILMLLLLVSEGQVGKTLATSNKLMQFPIGGALDRKLCVHLSSQTSFVNKN